MKNVEFYEFYVGRLRKEKTMDFDDVVKRSQETFRLFSWKDISEKMSEQFEVGFGNLRRGLEKSDITKSIQNVFLDEFVFLATQSSILSRMKKIFRVFEKFDAFPLLNLEKRAPPEWRGVVRGIKKAVTVINWIGFIGGYSLIFSPPMLPLAGGIVKGIRLALVDP